MGLILLALQVADHAGRDFTLEGWVTLAGAHTDVRILTVTTVGELSSDPQGASVVAQAAVVDGVVEGGPKPLVIAAGGLQAGRCPVLLSPASGVLVQAAPALEWYAASPSLNLSYELTIQGPAGVVTVPQLSGTSANPAGLPNGSHVWNVEAHSALGVYSSEEWAFTLMTGIPPAGEGPLAVAGDLDGDGVTSDSTPTLAWPAVPGASGYVVTLYGADGTPVPGAGGSTSPTGFAVSQVLPPGTYYAVVQPVDGSGGPLGEAISGTFVVDPAESETTPQAGGIVLVGDADGDGTVADATPTLTWPPVAGADSYAVTIYGPDGSPILSAGGMTSSPSFTVAVPLPNGTYSVAVQPLGADGTPLGSPMTGSFTVAVPTDLVPPGGGSISVVEDVDGDGATSTPTPTLTWPAVPGASTYAVTLVGPDGTVVVTAGGTTPGNALFVMQALPAGTYTVLIQPVDPDGAAVGDLLVGAFVVDPTEVEETVVVVFSFDDPSALAGWVVEGSSSTVAWGVDGTPAEAPGGAARSGSSGLNYNNGVDYITPGAPNWGIARSPVLPLAHLSSPRLRFWCNYDTRDSEGAVDARWLSIVSERGETMSSARLSTEAEAGGPGPCRGPSIWHAHELVLDPSWGDVQIEFRFETVDVADVSLSGWFLDDAAIVDEARAGESGSSGGPGTGPGELSGGSPRKLCSLSLSAADRQNFGDALPWWGLLALVAVVWGRRSPVSRSPA